MVSRRKLEEEIARSKDPVIRKQLQKLLEKRSQRWAEKEKKAKGFLDKKKEWVSTIPDAIGGIFLMGIVIVLIALVIRLILWLVGCVDEFWWF